ncbi:hypothetical protein Aristophanes_00013 [Acinetobacter phage Aristophanes]|uniref:Uncharacterized protein n=1 Tax=Acinetobacter phage Aristophanes TaxID=2759203 RepID=A0A7G9VYM2_BPACA|nr:hypothetical protein Aristophanes_00013 [Acinetobacter phage Aristophanes]
MKIKNCVVGTEVQIKNIDVPPTECSPRTAREYGVIEENYGIIQDTPDEYGDVKVYFGEQFEHSQIEGRKYLYVHHSNLRHFNKD